MTDRNNKRIIHRLPDANCVFLTATESFVRVASEAIERRGRFMVALSGGSTPKAMYEMLTMPEFADRIDWSVVEWFWSDERAVPDDHVDSNYKMAYEILLRPLKIKEAQIHRMAGEQPSLDAAAQAYEQELADIFQISATAPPPRFDLILLGMGDDGHTASLFPQTAALDSNDRWIVANDIPQLQTRRLTMTFRLINQARHIFFLVIGEKKARRLFEVLSATDDMDPLPCQRIVPTHGVVEWFLDEAIARDLR